MKYLICSKTVQGLFGVRLSLIPKGIGERIDTVTVPYLIAD